MQLRALLFGLVTLTLSTNLMAKPPVPMQEEEKQSNTQKKETNNNKKTTLTKVIEVMLCNGSIIEYISNSNSK